mmetsp:Transcript_18578/g.58441  ORF Transcript_18578/g.58441 Transcript_18578/m.58441 type:complete len:212 (-) Transcript_18578:702-1337(-)
MPMAPARRLSAPTAAATSDTSSRTRVSLRQPTPGTASTGSRSATSQLRHSPTTSSPCPTSPRAARFSSLRARAERPAPSAALPRRRPARERLPPRAARASWVERVGRCRLFLRTSPEIHHDRECPRWGCPPSAKTQRRLAPPTAAFSSSSARPALPSRCASAWRRGGVGRAVSAQKSAFQPGQAEQAEAVQVAGLHSSMKNFPGRACRSQK